MAWSGCALRGWATCITSFTLFFLGLLASSACAEHQNFKPPAEKPNVLFLIVDDLRPALGCYGYTENKVLTPNIDQLASRAIRFNNAYVQQALCGPSRVSFLTSRRPDTTRLYDFASYWRDVAGNYTTLPQYFKQNGYFTQSLGKVFHPGKSSGGHDDYPYSWSVPTYHAPTQRDKNKKVCENLDGTLAENLICPVDVSKQPMKSLPDLQIKDAAIEALTNLSRKYKQDRQPFFLAVGFHKPHVPFKYPKEYLRLFPLSSIGLAPNPHLPLDLPPVAWEPWWHLRSREDVAALNLTMPYGLMPDLYARKIRQNYYAASTYMDSMVGEVLNSLDELGLANNTIVTFHGDHGWQLGEHQEWEKYSNFKVATNVPLLVYVPGTTHPKMAARTTFPFINPFSVSGTNTSSKTENISGERQKRMEVQAGEKNYEQGRFKKQEYESDALVELVDLFPTLADLTGMKAIPQCPVPSNDIDLCTEGHSFAAVIRNVTGAKQGHKALSMRWKNATFSQYPRPSLIPDKHFDEPSLHTIQIMGYSMLTHKYRYAEWVEFNHTTFTCNWDKVYARELYMYNTDPQEDHNVATDRRYRRHVEEASYLLHRGWKLALPL